jgi:hypothetical protein
MAPEKMARTEKGKARPTAVKSVEIYIKRFMKMVNRGG